MWRIQDWITSLRGSDPVHVWKNTSEQTNKKLSDLSEKINQHSEAESVQLNLLLERSAKIKKDTDNEQVLWEESEKHLNEEFKAVETLGTAELQTLEAQRTEVLTNIQGMLDEQLFELNLNSVK